MAVKQKFLQSYGRFIAWLVRPGMAPIIKVLHDRQNQMIERMMDKDDYRVTPTGVVKRKK